VGRAKTERERLKGLEAVRASTVLALRAMGEPDEEALELLERNLEQAEQAFMDTSGGFEVATRALQGVREAIRQRMEIVRVDGEIETSMSLSFTDENGKVVLPGKPGKSFSVSAAEYFRGTPARFHDPTRFRIERTIFGVGRQRAPGRTCTRRHYQRACLAIGDPGQGLTATRERRQGTMIYEPPDLLDEMNELRLSANRCQTRLKRAACERPGVPGARRGRGVAVVRGLGAERGVLRVAAGLRGKAMSLAEHPLTLRKGCVHPQGGCSGGAFTSDVDRFQHHRRVRWGGDRCASRRPRHTPGRLLHTSS
jgi:hypothetical protein